MSSKNPKIQIPKDKLDKTLEWLALIGLVVMIIAPIVSMGYLPEKIPIHFNASGQPDGYGSRISILGIPLLGTFLYAMLTWMNKFPHTFNYPVDITPENAAHQYRIALRMTRTLKAIIIPTIAFLCCQTIWVALGKSDGLGKGFLPLFLIAIFGSMAYFIWQAHQNK